MRWFYCLCLSFDCVCNLQLRKAQRRSRSMSMTKSREIADALATDNPKRLKWPKCQPDPYQLTSCMQVLEVLDLKTCFCIDLGLYDGAAKKNMLFKIHVHYRTIAVVGAHRTHASSVQNWTVHPFAKSLQTKPSNVFQGLCRHVNSRSWLMTSSNSWSNRDRLVLSKRSQYEYVFSQAFILLQFRLSHRLTHGKVSPQMQRPWENHPRCFSISTRSLVSSRMTSGYASKGTGFCALWIHSQHNLNQATVSFCTAVNSPCLDTKAIINAWRISQTVWQCLTFTRPFDIGGHLDCWVMLATYHIFTADLTSTKNWKVQRWHWPMHTQCKGNLLARLNAFRWSRLKLYISSLVAGFPVLFCLTKSFLFTSHNLWRPEEDSVHFLGGMKMENLLAYLDNIWNLNMTWN